MRKIFAAFVLLFLNSCRGESPREEIKTDTISSSVDSLMDSSHTVIDSVVIRPEMNFREKAILFREKMHRNYDSTLNLSSILPGRFEAEFRTEFGIIKEEEEKKSTVINFFFYEYSDSSSQANVLSNWFSCYGKECIVINQGENIRNSKLNNSVTIIDDFFILHFFQSCDGDQEFFNSVRNEILYLFRKKRSKEILTDCKYGLKWMK